MKSVSFDLQFSVRPNTGKYGEKKNQKNILSRNIWSLNSGSCTSGLKVCKCQHKNVSKSHHERTVYIRWLWFPSSSVLVVKRCLLLGSDFFNFISQRNMWNKRKDWCVEIVQKYVNNCHVIIIRRFEVDFILLAGYIKLIPVELIQAYPRSIVNIHPSLLPAFGGKGYYGMKVHKAVIAFGAR